MPAGRSLSRRTLVKGAVGAIPALLLPSCAASASAAVVDTGTPSPKSAPGYTRIADARILPGLVSTSLLPGKTYTGVVPLTAQFDTAATPPSQVSITIGRTTFPLVPLGVSGLWMGASWDTMVSLGPSGLLSPDNYCAWVSLTAVIGGATQTTPLYPVYTGNYDYGELPDRGWDPKLQWAADYSSPAAWLSSFAATVVGKRYATLVEDPVRGRSRRVVSVTLPDAARFDSDQPTNSPRFQAQQPTSGRYIGFSEGHEFYVGFSIFVPTTDSSAAGAGGFPSVALSRSGETNKHIAIFQMYGPQARTPSYPAGRGAITIIDANRTAAAEPLDRFHISGNQLNAGDQGFLVDFSYNRGAWTDIVLGIRMSADVQRGWIEVYLNQGDSATVEPVPLFGGLTRVPRVTAWPEASTPALPAVDSDGDAVSGGSRNHRTDMQVYRSPTAYEEVTLLHTGHRVGPSVESVDPLSYA